MVALFPAVACVVCITSRIFHKLACDVREPDAGDVDCRVARSIID